MTQEEVEQMKQIGDETISRMRANGDINEPWEAGAEQATTPSTPNGVNPLGANKPLGDPEQYRNISRRTPLGPSQEGDPEGSMRDQSGRLMWQNGQMIGAQKPNSTATADFQAKLDQQAEKWRNGGAAQTWGALAKSQQNAKNAEANAEFQRVIEANRKAREDRMRAKNLQNQKVGYQIGTAMAALDDGLHAAQNGDKSRIFKDEKGDYYVEGRVEPEGLDAFNGDIGKLGGKDKLTGVVARVRVNQYGYPLDGAEPTISAVYAKNGIVKDGGDGTVIKTLTRTQAMDVIEKSRVALGDSQERVHNSLVNAFGGNDPYVKPTAGAEATRGKAPAGAGAAKPAGGAVEEIKVWSEMLKSPDVSDEDKAFARQQLANLKAEKPQTPTMNEAGDRLTMPNGRVVRPGDSFTDANGKTMIWKGGALDAWELPEEEAKPTEAAEAGVAAPAAEPETKQGVAKGGTQEQARENRTGMSAATAMDLLDPLAQYGGTAQMLGDIQNQPKPQKTEARSTRPAKTAEESEARKAEVEREARGLDRRGKYKSEQRERAFQAFYDDLKKRRLSMRDTRKVSEDEARRAFEAKEIEDAAKKTERETVEEATRRRLIEQYAGPEAKKNLAIQEERKRRERERNRVADEALDSARRKFPIKK